MASNIQILLFRLIINSNLFCIFATMTAKQLVDDILNIITKFGRTKSQRYNEDWVYFKINQIRGTLIPVNYRKEGSVNPMWFQDLNLQQFTPVKESDLDWGICGNCKVYKAIIPANIQLFNTRNSQNKIDEGIKIMSPCGTKEFYPISLEAFKQIPEGHPKKLFDYYWRIGNAFYQRKAEKLRIHIIPRNPEEINTIQNTIIPSGQLVVGTQYKVLNYQIVTGTGQGYNVGATFTATTSTYTGQGNVVLANPVQPFDYETTEYPVDDEIARQIVVEIITKELGLSNEQITAFKNEYGATNNQPTNKAAQV